MFDIIEAWNSPSPPKFWTRWRPMGDMMSHEHDSAATATGKRAPRYQSHSLDECITNLSTPRGPKPVLKSMVTTACERNCFYCPFRAGRSKMARVTFTPDAMAGAFDTLVRAKKVDGLFLSSGIIKGSVTTQDKLIDTVQIVRRKYNYRGYVHLKVMPGIERDQLAHMMRIADRVSVNLEAPTEQRLAALAPKKEFLRELLQMLRWANEIRAADPHQKWASTVTQFVVGAVGDTDLELLSLSENLYRQLRFGPRLLLCIFAGFRYAARKRERGQRNPSAPVVSGQLFAARLRLERRRPRLRWQRVSSRKRRSQARLRRCCPAQRPD
ncbi:MAG: hypothetical protein HND48_11515 [Chloroflexi bacterium]|nr:hypothetical protein [Chloroflexota bacterium]